MATLRGTAAETALTNSDASLVLPAASPAAQVGDLAVVWVTGASSTAPTYSPPSSGGWQLIAATRVFDTGSPGVALEAWWKVLTSADLASSSWSWDPAHGAIVTGTVYAPAAGKLLRPVEALAATASTSTATRTTPTLTTAGPRLLVTAYADRSGSAWTVPAGQEVRHDVRRGTGASSLLVTDSGSTLLAAGDLSRTVTASAATSTRAEGALALEEYDAPSTPPPTTEPQDPGTEAPPGWLTIPAGWARVELLVKGGGTSTPPPASSTTDYNEGDFKSSDYA